MRSRAESTRHGSRNTRLLPSLALTVLSVSPDAFAQDERFVTAWDAAFGESGFDAVPEVAVDSQGDLVLIASLSNSGKFVVKYDGRVEAWRVRLGGGGVSAYGMTVDSNDNILVIGKFGGTMVVDTDTLQSAGSGDVFLASWAADGVYRWSRRFGSASDDTGADVVVDSFGNITMTGSFGGTLDLGGGPLVADYYDCFVAQFDASLTHLWSARYQYGADEWDAGVRLALGPPGVVYVGVNSVFSYDSGFELFESYDSNLIAYDAGGQVVWAVRAGFPGGKVMDLAVDVFGDVVVVGEDWVDGSMAQAEFTFVSKYAPDGSTRWRRLTHPVWARGVSTDESGDIIVVGDRGSRGVIVGNDPGGTPQWTQNIDEAPGSARVERVDVDPAGNLALAGSFFGDLVLGDTTYVNAGSWDAFVARGPRTVDYDIKSIADVPNDQGGFVELSFTRGPRDIVGARFPVLEYQIYLRDDPLPAGARASQRAAIPGWLLVTAVPANGSDAYDVAVPTMADSTVTHGMHRSVYQVRAVTGDPGVFTDSMPDSGYSVDNIAPTAPVGLAYAAGALTWGASPDPDLDHYSVWGSLLPDLDENAVFLGTATVSPFDVSAAPHSYYFVRAFDDAGNASAASSVAGEPDGVAPGAPLSLSYDAGTLNWAAPPDVDVASYFVYGSMTDTLGASEPPLAGVISRTYDAVALPYPYFFVSAVDLADNEGIPARTRDDLAPAAPTGVSYDGTAVAWSPSADPGLDVYRVYGYPGQIFRDFIAETRATSLDVSNEAYASYQVSVVDYAGNESALTSVNDAVVPPPPTNLQVRSGVLSWTAAADPGVIGYNVYGSQDDVLDSGDEHIETTPETSLDVRDDKFPYYAVTATDAAGNRGTPGWVRVDVRSAYPLALAAYPNPFNPGTTVRFDVPERGRATVSIFDPAGRLVTTLFDGDREPGSHTLPWNGRSGAGEPVSSGIYFVRFEHSTGTKTLKLVLIR